MPMYEYRCPECKGTFSAFKKLAAYREPQQCACGVVAEKVISKPMVAVDYPAYESPATGRIIEGKRQHQEELKRTGCRILEPGERTRMERVQKESAAKLETSVTNSVDQIFAQLKG